MGLGEWLVLLALTRNGACTCVGNHCVCGFDSSD